MAPLEIDRMLILGVLLGITSVTLALPISQVPNTWEILIGTLTGVPEVYSYWNAPHLPGSPLVSFDKTAQVHGFTTFLYVAKGRLAT